MRRTLKREIAVYFIVFFVAFAVTYTVLTVVRR